MTSQAIVSYLNNLKLFQPSRNTWAWAMDSTMGGIEYDDGGCVEETKRRKSHIDMANKWAMEMPTDWCQCKE